MDEECIHEVGFNPHGLSSLIFTIVRKVKLNTEFYITSSELFIFGLNMKKVNFCLGFCCCFFVLATYFALYLCFLYVIFL
jgi:hypothetical protein